MSMKPPGSIPRILLLALLTALPIIVVGAGFWRRTHPPRLILTQGQVLELLPSGSVLHSFARVELNERPPQEIAAVAGVPQFPGARPVAYYAFVFAYHPWQQRMMQVYGQPLPGPLPLSVDAGRLLAGRDVAIFVALHDDGTRSYRIVGQPRGIAVLHEGRVAGRIIVADPWMIEDTKPPRILVWDGRAFRDAGAVAIPAVPPGVTWRYSVRGGKVVARTNTVLLQPRQTLRLTASGGGPGVIIIPDPRFDVVESGFRARQPGVYSIRLLTPFAPDNTAYNLTVVVDGDR